MKGFFANTFSFFWDLIKVTLIALVLVGLVRYFLFQPFFVQGASMEPTFEDGEYLIVDELSYYFRTANRGEVIVFKYPLDTSQYFIKRVVGLSGETVEIKNGEVKIYNKENPNGFLLKEKYLPDNLQTLGDIKAKLGAGEYFVLGDNRSRSADSRRFGSVPKEDIVGKVFLRAWPPARAQIFSYSN